VETGNELSRAGAETRRTTLVGLAVVVIRAVIADGAAVAGT
jgi:hypothetical protein